MGVLWVCRVNGDMNGEGGVVVVGVFDGELVVEELDVFVDVGEVEVFFGGGVVVGEVDVVIFDE